VKIKIFCQSPSTGTNWVVYLSGPLGPLWCDRYLTFWGARTFGLPKALRQAEDFQVLGWAQEHWKETK